MGVKILVFGKLAEVICLKEMEIADVKDVAALRSLLIKKLSRTERIKLHSSSEQESGG